MNSLIFRTITPYLTSLMFLFSIFVLLRGHNNPGGGFIGGLIAVSAVAIYGIAFGVASARRALYFQPLKIAASGVIIAAVSGLASLAASKPFLTGLWFFPTLAGTQIGISTVLLFDIGGVSLLRRPATNIIRLTALAIILMPIITLISDADSIR